MRRLFFYHNMAKTNLKNHAQLYIPYTVVGVLMTAMFYILAYLGTNDKTTHMKGGAYLPLILQMGTGIVGFLAVVLLLYSNSFLMKRRKKEFGVYNILGMEKRHIVRVMFLESLYCSVASIIMGLAFGVFGYKLLCLILTRLLRDHAVYGFSVSPSCILVTIVVFVAVYSLSFVVNCISIARLKTIELLHSDQTGEKEPRIKWIALVIGLVTVGIGYYIALSTASPLKAIEEFFIAVILVILGTYCLFMAGSIAILKMLKNNKKYYYNPKHMTAVSGLLYRMKQNAVGLASICILSTAVLVMLSTTVSLYAGIEDNIKKMSPYDLEVIIYWMSEEKQVPVEEIQQVMYDQLAESAEKQGLKIEDSVQLHYLFTEYQKTKDGFASIDAEFDTVEAVEEAMELMVMTEEQYNALTKENVKLADGEVAAYVPKSNRISLEDDFVIDNTKLHVKKRLKRFPCENPQYSLFNCFYFVVKDEAVLEEIVEAKIANTGQQLYRGEVLNYPIFMNFSCEEGNLNKKIHKARNDAMDKMGEIYGSGSYLAQERSEIEEYYYGLVGGLFFLGITLGVVFLFAMVLIIYYKQISEGYEDRERFQIMLKVGMSKKEVSQSIKSQILQVFFLPVMVAILHLVVVFPMLTKLLAILSYAGVGLYILCAAICVVVFIAIYAIVYSVTARVYYRIVTV